MILIEIITYRFDPEAHFTNEDDKGPTIRKIGSFFGCDSSRYNWQILISRGADKVKYFQNISKGFKILCIQHLTFARV